MKRAALYSSTPRTRVEQAAPEVVVQAPPPKRTFRQRTGAFAKRFERSLMLLAVVAVSAGSVLATLALQPSQGELTQENIDAAVLHTLENKTLPSRAAKAAESVREAVVRVRGYYEDPNDPKSEEAPRGVGSGVVIVDNGTILTNLHVVQGAKRVTVTFYDGHESEAEFVCAQPMLDRSRACGTRGWRVELFTAQAAFIAVRFGGVVLGASAPFVILGWDLARRRWSVVWLFAARTAPSQWSRVGGKRHVYRARRDDDFYRASVPRLRLAR